MSGKQQPPHISDFDLDAITFGPVEYTGAGKTKDKVKVDVFRDGTSTSTSNRFNRFNLCRDATQPMIAKYALDTVREDSNNPDRRGWTIRVSDPKTREAIEKLDEIVIKKAVECSKEWFGKAGKPLAAPLSEAVVRDRYQKLIYFKDETDEEMVVKVKVKTGGNYPTTIHLNEDGRFRKYAGRAEHLTRNAGVAPIVSMSYGIWIIPGGKFGLTMQVEEMMVTPGESVKDDLSHFASSAPIMMHEAPPPPTPSAPVETEVKVEALPVCDDDGETSM